MKQRKPKKCKSCGGTYTPRSSFQKVCSYKCAIVLINELRWKGEKKILKEKLKTHKDWIQQLQKVFNAYIRFRDKDLPCISCGTNQNVEYAAGHFYPTTYQFLRFNEDNVHKQCNKHCNMMLRGNLNEYRPHLEKKIGKDKLDWLYDHRHDRLDLSIPEIKKLINHYKNLTK